MENLSNYLPAIARTINKTLEDMPINYGAVRSNTLAFVFANLIVAFGTGEDVLPSELANFKKLACEFKPFLECEKTADHDYTIAVFTYDGMDCNQYDMKSLCDPDSTAALDFELSVAEKTLVEKYTKALIDKIITPTSSFSEDLYRSFDELAKGISGVKFEGGNLVRLPNEYISSLPSKAEKIALIDGIVNTDIFSEIFADENERDLKINF